jgi:hypothetical protein
MRVCFGDSGGGGTCDNASAAICFEPIFTFQPEQSYT